MSCSLWNPIIQGVSFIVYRRILDTVQCEVRIIIAIKIKDLITTACCHICANMGKKNVNMFPDLTEAYQGR